MPEALDDLIPVPCPRCGKVTPKMAKHLLLLSVLKCECGHDIDLTSGQLAAEIQRKAGRGA